MIELKEYSRLIGIVRDIRRSWSQLSANDVDRSLDTVGDELERFRAALELERTRTAQAQRAQVAAFVIIIMVLVVVIASG